MNLAEFHFIRPYWFLALIPTLIILVLLIRNKLNQGNWNKICDASLLPFILQEKPVHQNRWILSLAAFSSLLVIFALAGPTWERLPVPVFRNDAALVIALDLSRSMDAADIKPSRLSRARFKIADILKQRKDGQTALLVYAGDAFTVTPLTEDNQTIASQLSALTTEIMPTQGSNTVLAIEKALELLKQTGLQQGEILLVTDDIDFDKTEETIESLGAYRLSILGVGTAEGAPIKIAQGGFLKDAQGNIVVPKLNQSELSRLATKGNGFFTSISSDDSDIEAILNQLDKPLEKQGTENLNLLIEQWNEKGPWLLLLVLPLAALQFRKGLLSLTFILLMPFPETSQALDWNDLWQTQNQQAQEAFRNKNYSQAAEQYDDPQWQAAAQYKAENYQQAIESLQNDQSANGLYNLGNALAKSNKFQEAIEAYDKSLEIEPDNEDAKFNKEQVEKQQQQQQQQKNQKSDKNKDSEKNDSEQKDEEQGENQGENQDQSAEPNDSEQDSSAEQSEQQKPSEGEQESEEAEKLEQSQSEDNSEDQEAEETAAKQAEESSEYDESEQANEQWLNRIPDDPAGLLKRKFKYQYGQRKRKTESSQAW